jgi:hypothetical protein
VNGVNIAYSAVMDAIPEMSVLDIAVLSLYYIYGKI